MKTQIVDHTVCSQSDRSKTKASFFLAFILYKHIDIFSLLFLKLMLLLLLLARWWKVFPIFHLQMKILASLCGKTSVDKTRVRPSICQRLTTTNNSPEWECFYSILSFFFTQKKFLFSLIFSYFFSLFLSINSILYTHDALQSFDFLSFSE